MLGPNVRCRSRRKGFLLAGILVNKAAKRYGPARQETRQRSFEVGKGLSRKGNSQVSMIYIRLRTEKLRHFQKKDALLLNCDAGFEGIRRKCALQEAQRQRDTVDAPAPQL